jgi:hypothetical protein
MSESCTLEVDPMTPSGLVCNELPIHRITDGEYDRHAGDVCPICEIEGQIIWEWLQTNPAPFAFPADYKPLERRN